MQPASFRPNPSLVRLAVRLIVRAWDWKRMLQGGAAAQSTTRLVPMPHGLDELRKTTTGHGIRRNASCDASRRVSWWMATNDDDDDERTRLLLQKRCCWLYAVLLPSVSGRAGALWCQSDIRTTFSPQHILAHTCTSQRRRRRRRADILKQFQMIEVGDYVSG